MKADEAIQTIRGFTEDIVKWSEAYPTTIFHEPTPEQIDEVCKASGFRIDAISAMVLRAFTKPFGDKARDALPAIDSLAENVIMTAGVPETGVVNIIALDERIRRECGDRAKEKAKTFKLTCLNQNGVWIEHRLSPAALDDLEDAIMGGKE